MAITLSQRTYWELLTHSEAVPPPEATATEHVWRYPAWLGRGYRREQALSPGLHLDINDYYPEQGLQLHAPERWHPIEMSFHLAGGMNDHLTQAELAVQPGHYALYGSGIAPEERCEWSASRQQTVVIHLQPEYFEAMLATLDPAQAARLRHLNRPDERYYVRTGPMTPAMQTVLHQLLQNPYDGLAQRFFLEAKVLELVGLLLGIEQQLHSGQTPVVSLKPGDCDRIYAAQAILQAQMEQPPSLRQLARQVGLNECTLKRGFRQVLGTTAYGYLHQYRLEQARQYLATGQLNVTEVARRVGFANRSYFAAAFRKRFGVNPSAVLGQKNFLQRSESSL